MSANNIDYRTLTDISDERDAQDAKHGGPDFDDHNSATNWITYIGRHRIKARNAIARHADQAYEKQLIRIAALAIAALESHRRTT